MITKMMLTLMVWAIISCAILVSVILTDRIGAGKTLFIGFGMIIAGFLGLFLIKHTIDPYVYMEYGIDLSGIIDALL